MQAAKPVVLIVDDDAFVRTLLSDALGNSGYTLLEAQDGDEALERVKKDKPAVVLLDLFMPKKSGLDALRDIRGAHPPCKVLVISSLDSESLIDQALRSGASGFIAKPFHPLEIAEEVRKALTS